MTENFYLDNPDIQFHLEKMDLRETFELKEKGYSLHETYPAAPRNYKDAKDNCRLMLEILGEICARVIAPRAAEADEEGAQRDGAMARCDTPLPPRRRLKPSSRQSCSASCCPGNMEV